MTDLRKLSDEELRRLVGATKLRDLPDDVLKKMAETSAQDASISDRFMQGVRDPIDAGAQLLTHVLPDSVVKAGNEANNWLADKTGMVSRIPEGGVDQMIAEREKQYQGARAAAGQDGIDWARLAGNVVSPANLAIASKIPAGATLAQRLASGIGSGATMGLTSSPVTEGDYVTEKGKQILTGALGGGLTGGGTAAIARVVKPNTREQIAKMLTEGVTPTPGQIMGGRWQTLEDKMTSVPILGDAIASARGKGLDEFNQAAYRRALDPVGGKTIAPVGREAVADVRKQLGQAYDALLPKLKFQADGQFAADVNKLNGMAASMPPTQAKQFEKIFADKLVSRLGPKGTMDGEALKGVESELGQLAKGYRNDTSFDNRQLGDAIGELQTAVRQTLQRTNPQYAAELKSINEGYANYARLRAAASGQGAADGKFTAAQLSAAVRAQDKTVGKRAFSEGDALMQDLSDAGKNALAPKYPDSGTAGRVAAGVISGGLMTGGAAAFPFIGAKALAGGAVATLPYMPGGRQAMAALLAKRPAGSKEVADTVRKLAPFLSPASIPLLNQAAQPAQ